MLTVLPPRVRCVASMLLRCLKCASGVEIVSCGAASRFHACIGTPWKYLPSRRWHGVAPHLGPCIESYHASTRTILSLHADSPMVLVFWVVPIRRCSPCRLGLGIVAFDAEGRIGVTQCGFPAISQQFQEQRRTQGHYRAGVVRCLRSLSANEMRCSFLRSCPEEKAGAPGRRSSQPTRHRQRHPSPSWISSPSFPAC